MIDLHSHHVRCGHARGQLRDYVQAAQRQGLAILGVSDHAPLFAADEDHPAPGMHMPKSAFSRYLEEATSLQVELEHQGGLELLIGIEADFIPGSQAVYRQALADPRLDYVLGSVHYFEGYHVYDPQRWHHAPNVNRVYQAYLQQVQVAAQSGLFDIMAHIDAIKGLGHWPDQDMQPSIDATVAVLRACDVAVEINTSGLRKCDEPFPAPAIIAQLHRAGVPLTFGSDAHKPSELGYAWPKIRALLEDIGVQTLVIFRKRQRYTIPLAHFEQTLPSH